MKNRFIHRAKISENRFKQLLHLFCLELNALQISDISGMNRNTVNRYLTGIRRRICQYCRRQSDGCFSNHAFEEEQRCCENGDGISFLGIAKDNGNIRSRIIPEDVGQRLCSLPKARKNGDGDVMISVSNEFSGLIDLKKMRYIKIGSGTDGDDERPHGIDICDGFWGVVRARLHHFRGLRKSTLLLHIRECEFRYNHDRKEMYPILLRVFRDQPLFE